MIDSSADTPPADVTPNTLNFVKDGKIFIHGNFEDNISKEVIPQLIKRIEEEKLKKQGKIQFYIDSNGGYTRYLMDLLGLIENAKDNGVIIETFVFSYAYSCGSMLACAGTKGHRYIGEHAEHLCHLGQTGTGGVKNDTELERRASRSKSHFDFVRKLYKKYAKIKDLEKAIANDDYFIRGKDIITNGLADKFY